MISSDSATATRTWTATCAERLPGLDMTSPNSLPKQLDHRFEVIIRLNFTSTDRLSRRIYGSYQEQ